MTEYRITSHPILEIDPQEPIEFTWQGQPLTAQPGETIATALFAHGIRVFGHHHRDGSPQGIFCANGQCAQCMVIADGHPVKACMTPVVPGMHVEPLDGLPELPPRITNQEHESRMDANNRRFSNQQPATSSFDQREKLPTRAQRAQQPATSNQYPATTDPPVLILGGGPAGMSAALELARHGVKVLLVDDKARLGGKLVLQTHRFFGDINAVYAGTRGIDIAKRLENEVRSHENITVWLNSTALAVFSDGLVGVLRNGTQEDKSQIANYKLQGQTPLARQSKAMPDNELRITNYEPATSNHHPPSTIHHPPSTIHHPPSNLPFHESYHLVKPRVLLVATGAREKSLVFRGNTLPGVYGAGAFQTLVNRDRVRAAERLFIVGGGNVGLIAGYHALQAGITVVGLVEALPECGGYKVHKDKLVRLGVPVYTSHTVLSANGDGQVESVTIAQVDAQFRPTPGSERTFACDTILIAVGLEPVDEFTVKARQYGMTVFDAGDAAEIAEASAAIFAGKIRGREIAQHLGANVEDVPGDWYHTAEVLKSRPGEVCDECVPEQEEGVVPVFHCSQEIPCNPCTSVCPQELIHIDPDDIRAVPTFLGPHVGKACLGCERCVTICPGLAITLVDYRKNTAMPTVTLAYEFQTGTITAGEHVTVLDRDGNILGRAEVVQIKALERNDHTAVLKVRAPKTIAKRIAGIRLPQLESWEATTLEDAVPRVEDDEIVCRCERVTAGTIRELIRKGYRDMNEIKAVTRAGMGACGGKTCTSLILRLFREKGVPPDEITSNVKRPLFVEVPLGIFGGITNYKSRITNETEGCTESQTMKETGSNTESQDVGRYDAIIVGAGSVGVPAALALTGAGVKVLVVDRAPSQGQGSNKAAIGGVRATHSDPAKIHLCLRSLEIFSTWQAKHGHNIEWTTGGYSFVAYRPEEEAILKSLLEVQHRHGLDIDWYDSEALLAIVPDLNPEGLRGGTYSPGDGHCSTLLAGHAFYDAAKQAGATFHFNETLQAILTEPQKNGAHRHISGIRTDQGEYHAPVVINAAGAWAAGVGRLVGLNHPILPESHEAGITEPLAHFLAPMMVDIRPAPGSKNYYFFQLHSGQIVFCLTPQPNIPGCDRRETSTFLPLVAPRMIDLIPRLAAARVRRTWRGLYPMTPDGVPVVGWAREVEGYLMAIGMCGQGFMLGPGLGELLARMVTRSTTAEDQETLKELSPYRAFAGEEALK